MARTALTYSAILIQPNRISADQTRTNFSYATGFLWRRDDELYLVTNWHNVTGWDPTNDKCLSETGAAPTNLDLPLLLKTDLAKGGQPLARHQPYNIPLFDPDGLPFWLEHPVFGNRVDVVAIRIGKTSDKVLNTPINAFDDYVNFDPAMGDDVFVIGYPGGLQGGPAMPIWKRGSIASFPRHDLDDLPKLLIDTATRQGMSGSPTIVRRSGIIVPNGVQSSPNKLTGQELIGTAITFLGVYSGRIGNDPLGVQLGIVWKARVIDEIIDAQQKGKPPY